MNCYECPYYDGLLVERLIISTVKRTIEEAGLVSKYVTRREAMKHCSLTRLMNAERRGDLNRIKNGSNTSPVKYLRAEFERFLSKKNIE